MNNSKKKNIPFWVINSQEKSLFGLTDSNYFFFFSLPSSNINIVHFTAVHPIHSHHHSSSTTFSRFPLPYPLNIVMRSVASFTACANGCLSQTSNWMLPELYNAAYARKCRCCASCIARITFFHIRLLPCITAAMAGFSGADCKQLYNADACCSQKLLAIATVPGAPLLSKVAEMMFEFCTVF